MYITKNGYKEILSPSEGCIEVDDLIGPAIMTLNRKGYYTAFSCSGHAESGHSPEIAYIQFEFGGITPETLPDGWEWVCDGQMEHQYEKATEEEITAVMNDLSSWATELPDATK